MLVVLNNFMKNLFITKSSDLRSVLDRSKGSSPYNNIGKHLLFINCSTTSSDANYIRTRLVLKCVTIYGQLTVLVCNQPPESTQPGHPFADRRSDHRRTLGSKQAHRAMRYPRILVSGWGLKEQRSASPCGPCGSGKRYADDWCHTIVPWVMTIGITETRGGGSLADDNRSHFTVLFAFRTTIIIIST